MKDALWQNFKTYFMGKRTVFKINPKMLKKLLGILLQKHLISILT